MTILCGVDAYENYVNQFDHARAISNLLSTPREEIVSGVEKLLAERDALHRVILERDRKLMALHLASLPETDGNLCVVGAFDDLEALRELVNAGMERAGGVCAAFSGSDAEGYRYIIGSRHVDLRVQSRAINAAIAGRGGGTPAMIQGRAQATEAEIRRAILG